MSSRQEMLERVRRALGRSPQASPGRPGRDPLPALEPPLPAVPPEELVPKFEAELRKVGGVAYRASTAEELGKILKEILENARVASAILSRNPLLSQLGLPAKLRSWGKSVAQWPSFASLPAHEEGSQLSQLRAAGFAADVGITGVEFALAETGSLVLTSRTEGGQLASLAPPVHVALYRRSQTLGSLDEVLERLGISRDPVAAGRSVVFITGPSRTADIEQILVRGVHGPGEVHAILVEESCLV